MKFFIALFIFVASVFGLSYYKNRTIENEMKKELKNYPKLSFLDIECGGLINSDCHIASPKYGSIKIAEDIRVEGIDPMSIFDSNSSKELPASIFINGAKFSFWDLLAGKNPMIKTGDFYKRHSGDYNISAKLLLGVDGEKLSYVKILSLRAEDRFLPYDLSGNLSGFDSGLIIKKLNFSLDLSKKRELFDDFIDSFRECCIDEIPKEYQNMSNDELYREFKRKLDQTRTGFKPLNEAILALSSDDKKRLILDLDSKKDMPIKSMILPVLILGPKAVEKFYDIKVFAK